MANRTCDQTTGRAGLAPEIIVKATPAAPRLDYPAKNNFPRQFHSTIKLLSQSASNLAKSINNKELEIMQDYLEELLDQPLVIGQNEPTTFSDWDIDDDLDEYVEV